ncbi:MAG: hypothetical protein K8R36_14395 [Planctomycetales bacterium]|nr:hypothetical protein [Planctomycetales bacterium]
MSFVRHLRFTIADGLWFTLWVAALLALWRIHPGVDAAASILLVRENVWKGLALNASIVLALGGLLGCLCRRPFIGVQIGLVSAAIFSVVWLATAFYLRSTL